MQPASPAGPAQSDLLRLLADGRSRSGVELGQELGLSRAAIWKQVRVLRKLGLTIHADRRTGYGLGRPLELLDGDLIREALDPSARAALARLDVWLSTDSTNDRVGSLPTPPPGALVVCLSEYQSAGRGRRGRQWLGPPAHGLCLSLAWQYEAAPRDLPALSLVAGVSVAKALRGLGIQGIKLKWPNDLVVPNPVCVTDPAGKLGGILVEVAGESGGPLRVIVGIGLNVVAADSLVQRVVQSPGAARPVALEQLTNGVSASRNRVAASLISALHASLSIFGKEGFAPFFSAYCELDSLVGQPVTVTGLGGSDQVTGVAHGIGLDGSLLLKRENAVFPVQAGDVTLRGHK